MYLVYLFRFTGAYSTYQIMYLIFIYIDVLEIQLRHSLRVVFPCNGKDKFNYIWFSTANICKLQIAQCEYKLRHRYLGVAHMGTCSSGGTQTLPDHYDCRNPEPCDEEESTGEVCGTDGVTYSRREHSNSLKKSLEK